MKILIEEESYPLDELKNIIDSKFYDENGVSGTIKYIGYFYSFKNKEIVYLLPKVFTDINEFKKMKLEQQRYFLLLFYKSLIEYKKRNSSNKIVNKYKSIVLKGSVGDDEFSFLDIVLNIVNFHKENKNVLLFLEKRLNCENHKKVSWEKTVRKNIPILDAKNKPIYNQAINRKKDIDTQEQLLSIFYSVLFYLNNQYKLNVKIDDIYKIYKGKAYISMCQKAPKILKKIKHKYFSDILVKVYKLLELYFVIERTNIQTKSYEYFLVNNYHVIFEDMVDKLLSNDNKDIQKLKEQNDGKILDHLFLHKSIFNKNKDIHYIADSKYYKTKNQIEKKSIYKQFTYAKNIIQDNYKSLRDDITEGYDITPNCFIRGKIDNTIDFNSSDLEYDRDNIDKSIQFQNKLFDRDTLFVQHYDINFLYVLKSYSQVTNSKLKQFRDECYIKFRTNLINYLENNYYFYQKEFKNNDEMKEFIEINFKKLNGKMYKSNNNLNIILATNKENDVSSIELKKYIFNNK